MNAPEGIPPDVGFEAGVGLNDKKGCWPSCGLGVRLPVNSEIKASKSTGD